jgi:hypothetical protein
MNGKVLSTGTASGPYNGATAEICQATGEWGTAARQWVTWRWTSCVPLASASRPAAGREATPEEVALVHPCW